LILGNTVNPQFLLECDDVADAVKVGIGQGFACNTKNTAGCTEKQFSAVLRFKELAAELGMPIISDGGIREPADFTKAMAAGASSVMVGKVFAACPESAAEVCKINDKDMKLYAGMASEHVQSAWKGGLKDGTCAEGGVRYIEISESVEDLLKMYCGSLKSGITYAGAKDIKSLHQNVEFVLL
jgi:IMP dehydrogenase